jgi:outer membrane protein assembly factor BamD (BamD/ComL family)
MKSSPVRRLALVLALMGAVSPALPVFAQAPAAGAASSAAGADNKAQLQAFEALCAKMQQESSGASEDDVRKLVELAVQLGRPSAANVALKSYLGRNSKPSAAVLLLAADNAARACDFRAAVTRYKAYLSVAQPSPESAAAYARLCTITLDLLGEVDDAYDTVRRHGEKFRLTTAAKKFDAWYLTEARRRVDYAGAANRLAIVMADQMPLEQERLFYWDDLDTLLNGLAKNDARPELRQSDALLGLKKIVPLIRDNKVRSTRAAFIAAHLEYRSATAGKDAAELAKQFEKVIAAGDLYLQADPTAATLQDISTTGVNFDGGVPPEQILRQRIIFNALFDKLPDTQKPLAIDWTVANGQHMYALGDQWSALALKSPAIFAKAPGTRDLTFSVPATDPTIYEKQLAFLKGLPSGSAAINNTLAQGDLASKGMPHLFKNESWYFTVFNGPYLYLSNSIWSVYSNQPDKKTGFSGAEYFSRMLVANGPELIAKSPLAIFDRNAVRDYAVAVFNYSGVDADDKSKVAGLLHQMDWVPLPEKDRKEVFQPAYDEFKKWADTLRAKVANQRKNVDSLKSQVAAHKAKLDDLQKKKKPAAETDPVAAQLSKANEQLTAAQDALKAVETKAGQIAALEPELRAVMDFKINAPAKATDPLAKALAETVDALQDKNKDAFYKSARAAYALVRDYQTKKTPFGNATIEYLLSARGGIETFDLQLEILADQLKLMDPAAPNKEFQRYVGLVATTRGSSLGNFPRHAQDASRRIGNVLAQGIIEQVKKDQFSPVVLALLRAAKNGREWNDPALGADAMAALVEKKLLIKNNFRVNNYLPVASTMWLVASEFPGIAAKYPAASYYEDAFIQEALATGQPDWTYIVMSGDPSKKAIDAVSAKLLSQWDTLPLGYDARPANPRQVLGFWFNRALGASKTERDSVIAKSQAAYGKTRFDDIGDGRAAFSTSQFDLSKPEGRTGYFERLTQVGQNMAARPGRVPPAFLGQFSNMSGRKLSDAEATALVRFITESGAASWPRELGYDVIAQDLGSTLWEKRRSADLLTLAPWFWKVARDTRDNNYQRTLVQFTRELSDKDFHELAVAFATAGTEVLGADIAQDSRTALTSVKSRSLAFTGGAVAVPKSDPRYSIFAAQTDFLGGRPGPAWDSYLAKPDLALVNLKDLDPGFSIWLVGQNIDARNYEAAEQMIQQLRLWIDSAPTGFDPEVRASAQLAYANLMFAKQEYPRARAQYERVIAAPEFASTQARREAEIKIAEIDRVTRQFDKAVERLTKLLRQQDRFLQIEGNYEMSLVKFDQEDYSAAAEYLDRVFSLNPSHVNGRILEGKLQLKTNKLVEATQIKVGLAGDQRNIIPGQELKIDLEDRNLSVVGGAGTLEVHAWTDAGDDETFPLLPFGDSKTKFSGQIPTKLGVPAKNNRTLDLYGNTVVYYELSAKGSKNKLGNKDNALSVKVASDSELAASSGRILSKEEIDERDLEKKVRIAANLGSNPMEQAGKSLSSERAEDEIRPGNPIFVRVVNPSQSIDPKGSTVTVNVAVSSGDAIEGFVLKETTPFSGVYEGQIPTTGGQATATASDSNEGSEPNFAISPADHPAWVGQPNSRKPKAFSVDLNDNVALGDMSVIADVPGRKLKEFQVQVSPNGRQFTTVGGWPQSPALWDGSPKIDLVAAINVGQLRSYDDLDRYMNSGFVNAGTPMASAPLTGNVFAGGQQANLEGALAKNANLPFGRLFVARYSAVFYMPTPGVKTFEITPTDKGSGARYIVAIDGQIAGEKEPTSRLSRSLSSGAHKLEVFVVGYRSGSPNGSFSFTLNSDIPAEPYMAPAPMAMFDPAKEPKIKQFVSMGTAKITPGADNAQFNIAFEGAPRARVVRLLITDFETDAPAIKKVSLTRAATAGQPKGEAVLPTKQDFMSLRKDQTAQIAPGDVVTISYSNPTPLKADKKAQQAQLTATFNDAQLTACLVEYRVNHAGDRIPEYVALRRFRPGDPVNIFVWDPDMDTTNEPDQLKLTARAGDGAPIELTALETEKHSGIFLAKVFPTAVKPERAGEIQVTDGQEVIVGYMDKENTNPGIPWMREFSVEQAQAIPAQMRVFDVVSKPIPKEKLQPPQFLSTTDGRPSSEMIQATRNLVITRPVGPNKPDVAAKAPIDGPLIVEVIAPGLAASTSSKATLYAQTESGRKKAGAAASGNAFDINVPGTIKREVTPGSIQSLWSIAGYGSSLVVGGTTQDVALDQGRFTFVVPTILAPTPDASLVEVDPKSTDPAGKYLAVSGNDKVYLGFEYKDAAGNSQWVTQTIELTSEPFLDVMDRRYQAAVQAIHVGETVYLRLIDKVKDTTDERDNVTVELTTKSGQKVQAVLSETFGHSGIFKGRVDMGFAGAPAAAGSAPATQPSAGGEVNLPVTYGDQVTIVYPTQPGQDPSRQTLDIHKGADGGVQAFSKQYKDPNVAVLTQFAIAEAYIEQAKKHRELNSEQTASLARREIAQGRKLLEEALRDYPNTEMRPQAEYLLADLSAEFAADTVNEQLKKQSLADALARFSELVATYPDSPYAPKAQYKKALILEKMGQIDQAMEEYVKLSYRYPSNELVAETIARLGQYFMSKGKEFEDKANAEGDKLAQEKARLQARDTFKIAGQVFGRLGVRFPDHPLAGKTTVLGAQCYIRAMDYKAAVDIFNKVVDDGKLEKDLIAQSMYWGGDCYIKLNDLQNAYRLLKRVTLDYPESTWAKYARGRLTEESMASIDEKEKTK